MNPLSWVCTALFLAFAAPLLITALRKQHSTRKRITYGVLFALFACLYLFVPGFSPIRGALDARKADALCAHYAVGAPFDPADFARRAQAGGLRAIVNPIERHATAHALVILRVMRMCDVDYADGRVTKSASSTFSP